MVLDTACGAFAPSNSMASGILFRVSVPVQVRFSASVCGGTSPLFAPVAVVGVAPGVGVGEGVGVPGPPLKYSTCAVVAAVSTTTAMTTPTTLSRTRRFRLVSWTDCRAWYTRRRARSPPAPPPRPQPPPRPPPPAVSVWFHGRTVAPGTRAGGRAPRAPGGHWMPRVLLFLVLLSVYDTHQRVTVQFDCDNSMSGRAARTATVEAWRK